MKWIPDSTGRFSRRPLWPTGDLDSECENVVIDFLVRRHGRVDYPISTADLTVLIEERASRLDLYADLSGEGDDVEGLTEFEAGRAPVIRISARLASDPRFSNRLRTTLAHELGHVVLHGALYELRAATGEMFQASRGENKCRRERILGAGPTDWLEWQAGYSSGAFLMPGAALSQCVADLAKERDLALYRFGLGSPEARDLVRVVCSRFEVSGEAAEVRLKQKGILTDSKQAGLF